MTPANDKNREPAREDWESATLRRVARRMEDLPESPPEAEDFGWEEAVLQNLRQRLVGR